MRTGVPRFWYLIPVRSGFTILTLVALMAFSWGEQVSKGTLVYKGNKKTFTIDLTHGYFISGPDSFDPKTKIRRLIFTNQNLEAKIKSCEVMNCIDPLIEGIQMDLDAAHRILYWVSLDGQKVQYSGTAAMEAINFTSQSKDRLTGSFKIDNSGSVGPSVDVLFDVALLKTFAKHR